MAFKSPTSRRKSSREGIALNLVPILDTMVTLIAFVLSTMSALTLVSMESLLPIINIENPIPKAPPLQLTLVIRPREIEVLSPFKKIQPRTIPNLLGEQPNLKVLHDHLLSIKRRFPTETQIIFSPHSKTSYDQLVSIMDAVRLFEKTDPSIFYKPQPKSPTIRATQLFPNIVFGNLLESEEI